LNCVFNVDQDKIIFSENWLQALVPEYDH